MRLADKSLAMQPDDYMALKTRGEARLLLANWALDQHASPDAALAPALADFERAARANAKDFGVYELFGQASLLAAKGRLAAGRPADPQLDQGLRQVARGREVAGEDQSGLLEVGGRLHLLRAQETRNPQLRVAAARQAVAALATAVRLRPSLGPEVAPDLVAARRLFGETDRPAPGSGEH
jgi:hypothetical protein